jgi:outer membrane biosynthesis protein TonB
MDSLSDDIIKYKKGELSADQMHALEKKALADPFIADALEGIENISAEELSTNVSKIERKIKNKKKTILFSPLRIAAGIIFVAVSVFFIYQFIPEAETIALKTDKPKPANKADGENASGGTQPKVTAPEKEKEKSQTPNIAGEKVKVEKTVQESDKSKSPAKSELQPSTKAQREEPGKLNTEVEVKESIQQVPVQDLAKVEAQTVKTENADDQKSKEIVTSEPKGAGAKAASRDKKKDSFAASEVQRSAAPSVIIQNRQFISGQVVAAEDGSPLPGVNVMMKGTTIGTVTDLNGNYSISPSADNRSLVFSFIGLQQQEVDASGKDKIDVQMKEDVSQLSEVVVTGVGLTKDENHELVIRLAEPVGGKRAYENYLKSNLKYPEEALKNKIKGKAGIEFTVGIDGSLNDFQVIKKLGYGCDDEIIRLVKEGPKWTPSTEDNKPFESTVRVRLRFDPTKTGR